MARFPLSHFGALPSLLPAPMSRRGLALGALALAGLWVADAARADAPAWTACRLPGLETAARCAVVRRPLSPAQPAGPAIDVHVAVIPALARQKKPDPVFFLAGGPGQGAIDLAGQVQALLGRLGNRRDLVLVDQRGTGRSAPLVCPDEPATRPLAESLDTGRQVQRLRECRRLLETLPHGDLRQFSTWVAMQDLDAVRQALGAERINLVGGSYGTRAALEYLRQFPQRVRRVVLDGVAPPDMALPDTMAADAQAALDQVLDACTAEPRCAQRFPDLRAQWRRMLASLPREVTLSHPLTGRPERVTMTREAVLSMVRSTLYAPALVAGLPVALAQAAQGQFAPLLGLSTALAAPGGPMQLAQGMHFSVICAEDFPRMAAVAEPLATDFGASAASMYRQVCSDWPRGEVPQDFYRTQPSPAPVLVLSGGADPVTPPRHGERTLRALGPQARHVVVAQAGHGVMALPCVRDVLLRFIDAADDAQALAVEAACAAKLPRPLPFLPPAPGGQP